jgi:hypothetical protein
MPFRVMNGGVVKISRTGAHPEFFAWGGGADPEAIYNLFHFKNYVTKIIS